MWSFIFCVLLGLSWAGAKNVILSPEKVAPERCMTEGRQPGVCTTYYLCEQEWDDADDSIVDGQSQLQCSSLLSVCCLEKNIRKLEDVTEESNEETNQVSSTTTSTTSTTTTPAAPLPRNFAFVYSEDFWRK